MYIYSIGELDRPDELINHYIISMDPAIKILLSYSAYVKELPEGSGSELIHEILTSDENSGYYGAVSDDCIVYLADYLYCDVYRELANFFMANFGMMFGPGTLRSTIDVFNKHLVKVLESHSNYIEIYMKKEYKDRKCESQVRVNLLDLAHLAKLWYIYIVFVGIATIVYLGVKFYSKKCKIGSKISEENYSSNMQEENLSSEPTPDANIYKNRNNQGTLQKSEDQNLTTNNDLSIITKGDMSMLSVNTITDLRIYPTYLLKSNRNINLNSTKIGLQGVENVKQDSHLKRLKLRKNEKYILLPENNKY